MGDVHLTVGTRRLADLLRPADDHAHAAGPAYRALAERIRTLVLDGRVPLTARLPAERALADTLGISRTTVAAAYDLLRADGYLHSRRGAGSWTALPTGTATHPARGISPVADGGTALIDMGVAALPGPGRALHDAVTRAAEALPAYAAGHGYHPAGLPLLRETLAARYTRRGAPTTPDQIVVTTGALAAISLLLRATTTPGDRVAVEDPTYANVLAALTDENLRAVPIPMTDTGWDTTAWHDTLRTAAPRIAYTIADHQNPTGHRADEDTRRTLVHLAQATGTLLIADETCADLPLDHPAQLPPPLAAYDRTGTVTTIGSASKTFWGGLRVGWLRTSERLARRLTATRTGVDIAAPVLDQLVTHHLIAEHEQAVLAERLTTLRTARDHLAARLHADLPTWTFTLPTGGLSLWVRTDRPSTTALIDAAARHGVHLVAGTRFASHGAFEGHLRLPYIHDPATLTEAVRRVAAAHADTAGRPGSSRPGTPRTAAHRPEPADGCVA